MLIFAKLEKRNTNLSPMYKYKYIFMLVFYVFYVLFYLIKLICHIDSLLDR